MDVELARYLECNMGFMTLMLEGNGTMNSLINTSLWPKELLYINLLS